MFSRDSRRRNKEAFLQKIGAHAKGDDERFLRKVQQHGDLEQRVYDAQRAIYDYSCAVHALAAAGCRVAAALEALGDTSDDAATRLAAASAFVGYELSISKTFVEDKIIRECLETPSQLVPFAVMEVSYMLNAGFMSRGQLIAEVGKLSSLERVCISHGRSDFVCQPVSAYRLSEALGKLNVPVDLDFVAAAGHSDTEPGLVSSLITHSDGIRDLLAK